MTRGNCCFRHNMEVNWFVKSIVHCAFRRRNTLRSCCHVIAPPAHWTNWLSSDDLQWTDLWAGSNTSLYLHDLNWNGFLMCSCYSSSVYITGRYITYHRVNVHKEIIYVVCHRIQYKFEINGVWGRRPGNREKYWEWQNVEWIERKRYLSTKPSWLWLALMSNEAAYKTIIAAPHRDCRQKFVNFSTLISHRPWTFNSLIHEMTDHFMLIPCMMLIVQLLVRSQWFVHAQRGGWTWS